jgi:hypothetical protein
MKLNALRAAGRTTSLDEAIAFAESVSPDDRTP